MEQITNPNRLNDSVTSLAVVYKQSLFDGYLQDYLIESDRDKQIPIPCTITSSNNGITIAVEKYEDDMSVHFEYYNGKLQVFIWGEESLKKEGDCDLKYIITDKYSDFCRRIDELSENE